MSAPRSATHRNEPAPPRRFRGSCHHLVGVITSAANRWSAHDLGERNQPVRDRRDERHVVLDDDEGRTHLVAQGAAVRARAPRPLALGNPAGRFVEQKTVVVPHLTGEVDTRRVPWTARGRTSAGTAEVHQSISSSTRSAARSCRRRRAGNRSAAARAMRLVYHPLEGNRQRLAHGHVGNRRAYLEAAAQDRATPGGRPRLGPSRSPARSDRRCWV